jgi:hypothetical protein
MQDPISKITREKRDGGKDQGIEPASSKFSPKIVLPKTHKQKQLSSTCNITRKVTKDVCVSRVEIWPKSLVHQKFQPP